MQRDKKSTLRVPKDLPIALCSLNVTRLEVDWAGVEVSEPHAEPIRVMPWVMCRKSTQSVTHAAIGSGTKVVVTSITSSAVGAGALAGNTAAMSSTIVRSKRWVMMKVIEASADD